MTRVWTEGFEMQDLVEITHVGGVINTTIKRSGGASLKLYDYQSASFTKSITAVSEFYLRFGLYTHDTVYIYWKKGGTTLGYVKYLSGTLSISSGALSDSGSTILVPDSWYLIEIHVKIDDATGAVDVRLDGVLECNVSGDTKPSADTTVDTLYFIASISAAYTATYLDDMSLNDTAGGADDSWCGEGKIIMLSPNDDVTTELTQYPALTDHHADVDDFPADGDTTYVQGTVVDEEDLYELTASGLVAADVDTINRVWVESRSKDTTSTGGTLLLFINSNGTVDDGPDVTLSTSYTKKILSGEFLQNPDGPAAWSVAALDALRAGVRTRS